MIQLSGVPEKHILYVGDSVEKDVLPAKEVGILSGLLWSVSPEADYCFTSFKEILGVLK
jgi:FMN phosphatase YigB (HAD superfamily)